MCFVIEREGPAQARLCPADTGAKSTWPAADKASETKGVRRRRTTWSSAPR